MRVVGIGKQDFSDVRKSGVFYIDKTRFIAKWWDSQDSVTLITRPRRFGKTLTLSMTEAFFSLEYAGKLYNLETLSSVEALYSQPYEQFLQSEKCFKVMALRKIIAGKPFHMLNRRLRQEIVSMDGATIVDADGTIIATGAILKIEAGSEGGGRLAAAMTLAKYGISIKISQDGTILGFYNDKKTGNAKVLFNLG